MNLGIGALLARRVKRRPEGRSRHWPGASDQATVLDAAPVGPPGPCLPAVRAVCAHRAEMDSPITKRPNPGGSSIDIPHTVLPHREAPGGIAAALPADSSPGLAVTSSGYGQPRCSPRPRRARASGAAARTAAVDCALPDRSRSSVHGAMHPTLGPTPSTVSSLRLHLPSGRPPASNATRSPEQWR